MHNFDRPNRLLQAGVIQLETNTCATRGVLGQNLVGSFWAAAGFVWAAASLAKRFDREARRPRELAFCSLLDLEF